MSDSRKLSTLAVFRKRTKKSLFSSALQLRFLKPKRKTKTVFEVNFPMGEPEGLRETSLVVFPERAQYLRA